VSTADSDRSASSNCAKEELTDVFSWRGGEDLVTRAGVCQSGPVMTENNAALLRGMPYYGHAEGYYGLPSPDGKAWRSGASAICSDRTLLIFVVVRSTKILSVVVS
jgi:hypothetical protein